MAMMVNYLSLLKSLPMIIAPYSVTVLMSVPEAPVSAGMSRGEMAALRAVAQPVHPGFSGLTGGDCRQVGCLGGFIRHLPGQREWSGAPLPRPSALRSFAVGPESWVTTMA